MANHLRIVDSRMRKDMEKISSGNRINYAADDPSGLAVSQKMQAQITGIKRASKNAMDGIHFIQTAEGALMNIEQMVVRMRVLAVQSANGIYNHEDRMQIQYEVNSLIDEIDRIAKDSEFNTLKLLRGAFRRDPENANYLKVVNEVRPFDEKSADPGVRPLANPDMVVDPKANQPLLGGSNSARVAPAPAPAANADGEAAPAASVAPAANTSSGGGTYIHIGPNMDQRIKVYIENMSAFNLGLAESVNPDGTIKSQLDYSTTEGSNKAIGRLDTSLHILSRERANLGAYQNRLEHVSDYLNNSYINLKAARSQIQDTNVTEKMTDFVRDKILLESSSTMLSHSNVRSQVLLKLLNV